MGSRETWATRLGFILAAIGSAVGLGNIWRFPFITAESGGAAFLVVYLLLVAFIGLPVMLVEFVIGRESKQNVVDAFPAIGYGNWKAIGVIGSITGFIILSYYSVVGGWVIQYILGSITGAYTGGAEAYFGQVSSGLNTAGFDLLFILLVAGVVGFGVRDGLERAAKLLVPSVVGLMLFLAVYAATLPGAAEGYAYYLSPNLATLRSDALAILPAAAGQAFFTLSTGVGVMITYGSYLDEDRSLLRDGFVIMLADTCIAVLAGLIVFPVFFAQGIAPGDGGIGATFVSLAGAFTTLPGGRLIGTVFFVILLLAALTSAFSILEVIVSFIIPQPPARWLASLLSAFPRRLISSISPSTTPLQTTCYCCLVDYCWHSLAGGCTPPTRSQSSVRGSPPRSSFRSFGSGCFGYRLLWCSHTYCIRISPT